MSEHKDLAEFLRQQANSGDFGHDRERFSRAADLLEAAGEALAPADNRIQDRQENVGHDSMQVAG